MILEKFFALSEEKQNRIINAALGAFAAGGYKKTSVMDVAEAAGISKAMVFHYFETKKKLYIYLIEYCAELLLRELDGKFDKTVTDFFERILLAAEIKMAVIKRHPAILTFMESVYFETHKDVTEDIGALFSKGDGFRFQLILEGADTYKFKEDVDPKLVMKILIWLSEGCSSEMNRRNVLDADEMMREFSAALRLMRNHFYKEEYV